METLHQNYFDNLTQLLQDEDLSIKFRPVPGTEEIFTVDICIPRFIRKKFGYSKSPSYYNLLRDGLTYLQLGREYTLIRKGTKKPFKMTHDFLSYIKNFPNGPETRQEEKKRFLFKEAILQAQQGQKLEFIGFEKNDGIVANIGYYEQSDAWLISSQIACVIAKNRVALDNYYTIKGYSYMAALAIAESWFDAIEKLDLETVRELKRFLVGKTLVGELIGHPKWNRYLSSRERSLNFFFTIDNDRDVANPFKESYEKIANFGLSVAKHKILGECSNHEEFYEIMEGIFYDVYKLGVEECDRGYYIIIQNSKEIISNIIINSFEYNFFKLLFEKIKIVNEKNKSNIMKTIYEEADKLGKISKESIDSENYKAISKKFTTIIEKFDIKKEELTPNIYQQVIQLAKIHLTSKVIPETDITSLKKSISDTSAFLQNNRSLSISPDTKPVAQISIPKAIIIITTPEFVSKESLQNLKYTPEWTPSSQLSSNLNIFINYTLPEINHTTNFLNKYFILLGPHGKQAEEFKSQALKTFPYNFEIIPSLDESTQSLDQLIRSSFEKISQNTKSSLKTVLGIIPIGLPGMGKTTTIKALKKFLDPEIYEVSIISQDLGRKELIDKMRAQGGKGSDEELFQIAQKQMKNFFSDNVREAINRTESIKQSVHIILLDRGHNFDNLESALLYFKLPENLVKFNMKSVIMKPDSKIPFEYSVGENNVYFPFSLTFILTCLERGLVREHETLVGDDLKKASVVLNYLYIFKNVKILTEAYLLRAGANCVISLPFSNENTDFDEEMSNLGIRKLFVDLMEKMEDSKMKNFLKEFREKVKVPQQGEDMVQTALIEGIKAIIS